MYSLDWATFVTRTHRNCGACVTCPHAADTRTRSTTRWLPVVSSTVWALGLTSLLTDISSEMVASILPLYLVLHLGMSPFAFGFVDGLYQGAAALVRVAAGIASDRSRRYKEIAVSGYALSAVCRLLILAAGAAWSTIAAVIVIDRIGKGIRTAPRDALISQRSPCRELATAFGVHRALDAAGAMLGPALAFTLLAMMPRRFDILFVASFATAVVGVAAIMLFVPARLAEDRRAPGEKPVTIHGTALLLTDPSFRGLLIGAAVLGLATISDAFVFLLVQRRLAMAYMAFPLLYVGTSLFTSIFAVPFGRLADRVGRKGVLLAGYAILAAVYGLLLLPPSISAVVLAVVTVGMLGAYYAATDGVLTAMAAALLPRSRSGSGLAVLATATNLSRLAASVVFGLLWTMQGSVQATATYLTLLAAAIVLGSVILPRAQPQAESLIAID